MEARKKRYTRQTKMETDKGGSSDSDAANKDPDHQKTMQIITRLSQKYLKTKLTTTTSSSDSQTTDSEQEYYGDEENSPRTTENSDNSMSSPKRYQPLNTDSFQPRLVLSPVRIHAQTDSSTYPRRKGKSNRSANKTQNAYNVNVQVQQWMSVDNKTSTPIQTYIAQDTPTQRQLRKRKSAVSSDTATSTSVETVLSVRRSSPRNKQGSKTRTDSPQLRDSGVFISPPAQKRAKKHTQTTSTPSSTGRPPKLATDTGDDSCFGFDTIESPVLDVSPVKSVITPLSDYCSMSSTLFSSMDISSTNLHHQTEPMDIVESEGKHRVFFSQSLKSYNVKPNKKTKSKKAKALEKAEKWANQMNKEFEELENFELSIEG